MTFTTFHDLLRLLRPLRATLSLATLPPLRFRNPSTTIHPASPRLSVDSLIHFHPFPLDPHHTPPQVPILEAQDSTDTLACAVLYAPQHTWRLEIVQDPSVDYTSESWLKDTRILGVLGPATRYCHTTSTRNLQKHYQNIKTLPGWAPWRYVEDFSLVS